MPSNINKKVHLIGVFLIGVTLFFQAAAFDFGILAAIGKLRQYAANNYQIMRWAVLYRFGYVNNIALQGLHDLILPNDNQLKIYSSMYNNSLDADDVFVQFFAQGQLYNIPLSCIMKLIMYKVPILTSNRSNMLIAQEESFFQQLVRLILFAQHTVSVSNLDSYEIASRIKNGILKSVETPQNNEISYGLSSKKIDYWLNILQQKSGYRSGIFAITDKPLFFPNLLEYEKAKELLNKEDIVYRMPFITIATKEAEYELPVSEVYENLMEKNESIIIDKNRKLIPLFFQNENKNKLFTLISSFIKNPNVSHLDASISNNLWFSWSQSPVFPLLKTYEKNLAEAIALKPD